MKFLRDSTPFTQVLFTLIMILMGGILVSMVGFLVCRIGLGISFDDLSGMLANVGDPANVGLLKFFQVLQSLGMFILPPVFIAYSLNDKPFQFLQLTAKPALRMLAVVCGVILVSGPVIEWVSLLNQQLVLPSWLGSLESWMRTSEDQATEITKAFLTTKSIGGLLGNLFIVAVLPAIGEELLFRGVLQKLIQKMTGSSHWGIWITAILFQCAAPAVFRISAPYAARSAVWLPSRMDRNALVAYHRPFYQQCRRGHYFLRNRRRTGTQ